MDGKLAKDGADNVGIENVGLGPFLGQALDGLAELLAAPIFIRKRKKIYTFAREMERKQTLMSMPLIVTWPSPNLMPSRYNTLKL